MGSCMVSSPSDCCALSSNTLCRGWLGKPVLACRNVAVLTGAGCSTESNIPDYRGPGGAYSSGFKPMTHQQVGHKHWNQATLTACLLLQLRLLADVLPIAHRRLSNTCMRPELCSLQVQPSESPDLAQAGADAGSQSGSTLSVSLACSLCPTRSRKRATGPAPSQAGTSTAMCSLTLRMMP